MKYGKLTGFLAGFLLTFTPPVALAAKKAIDAQEDHSVQVMRNPGLESGKAEWTASSAPTFTLASSGSNLLTGKRSGVFNSSASGQTITGPGVVVNSSLAPGLAGRSWGFSCLLKGTATDYKLQAWDGTNVLAERVIPALSSGQRIGVTAPVTAGTTVRPRLYSQSDAADLAFDDCRVETEPTFDLSQAKSAVTGYFDTASNCEWIRSSGTNVYGAFSTDSDCPGPTIISSGVGSWSTSDTDLPQITGTNLPAGTYKFNYSVITANDATAANSIGTAVSDGSTTEGITVDLTVGGGYTYAHHSGTAVFVYTTAQTSKTFQFFGRYDGGTDLRLNNENRTTFFSVDYFPLASEQAQRFDTVGQSWQGYFPHTTCAFAKGTSPTVMGAFDDDGTCSLIQSSNTNFGTVTKNATGIAIDVPISSAGKFEVCADTVSYDGVAPTELSLQLRDSTGYIIKETSFTETGANDKHNVEVCGEWPVGSAGTKTLQLYAKSTAGAAYEINGMSGGTPSVTWRIKRINEQQPAPVLSQAVATPHAAVVNVCAFEFGGSSADSICSVSSCTIRKSTCGAPTVARLSGGDFEATFPASTFSAAPACTSSGFSWPSTNASANLITTTSTTARFQYFDDTATQRDVQANIICVGPR